MGTTCATGPASIGDGIVAIGTTINERRDSDIDLDSFAHWGGLTTFAVDPHDCVSQPPTATPMCPPLTQHALGSVSQAPAIRGGLVTFHTNQSVYDGSTGETFYSSGVATLDPATSTFPLLATSTDQSADGEVALVGDTIFELNGASVHARAASDGSLRWTAPLPAAGVGLSGGGGVVYVTTAAGVVHTFDAAGVQGCSGSPTTCTTLADQSASETTSISNSRLWLAQPGQLRVLRRP